MMNVIFSDQSQESTFNIEHISHLVLVLLLLTLLKLTLLHGCFSRFLNCANGTKSRNASHLPSAKTNTCEDQYRKN